MLGDLDHVGTPWGAAWAWEDSVGSGGDRNVALVNEMDNQPLRPQPALRKAYPSSNDIK